MDNKYFKELERENILKNEEKKLRKNQDEQEKKYHQEQEKKQRLEKLEKKNFKKTEKFLKHLGEHLNTIKKHFDRDNDDPEYKGLRKIENFFSEVDEEDYYKP